MHFHHDQDWAIENVGNWATDTLQFEMTFIVDPQGVTRFAMVDGKVTAIPIKSFLGDGLDSLLDGVKASPLGDAETGVVRADGGVAMVGAAAVHPHTDNMPPISGGYSILVYADLLDAAAVDNLRRAYLLDGLRLVPETPKHAEGVLALPADDGAPIAYLVWSPDRPGMRLLGVVLPLFGGLVITIAVLAAFILRHAKRTGTAISDSRQLALTDSLTGLPNRLLFEDRLQQALRDTDRNGGVVAVLCIDLDGFKRVNDLYGHACGDELLREVARLFRSALRITDTLARVGGDEFVVVQTARDRLGAEELATRLLGTISAPIILEGRLMPIGASIGIAFSGDRGETGSDILKRADLALYEAKRAGGTRYRVSQPISLLPSDVAGLLLTDSVL
jgi:diguanylate cyclase (GGDEF)-like protein